MFQEFCNKIRFGLTDEEKRLLRVKLDHKNDTSMSCFMNSLTDFYQVHHPFSQSLPRQEVIVTQSITLLLRIGARLA